MLVSDRMIKKMGGLLMLTSLLAGCSAGEGVVVSVHNSLDFARDGEMVEVPLTKLQKVSLKDGQKYVVVDAATKAQVPYQLTYDGMLIFPATVGAGATSSYTVKAGQPEAMDTVASILNAWMTLRGKTTRLHIVHTVRLCSADRNRLMDTTCLLRAYLIR